MRVLAIETSTHLLGVAVLEGERLLASAELVLPTPPHASELAPLVARLLKETRTPVQGLSGIAVDIGPGSFTGLRIGLAFVKALAFAHRVPVAGVSSLEALAANCAHSPHLVCPVMDAKRQNVYAALYRLEGERASGLEPTRLGPVEEAVPAVEGPVMLVGDGCAKFRERLLRRCPRGMIAPEPWWYPRPAMVGRIGLKRLADGHPDDAATLNPLYLYPLNCSVRGPLAAAPPTASEGRAAVL